MKLKTKYLAIILAIVMLISIFAVPVSALYGMSVTIYYKNEAGVQIAPPASGSFEAADGWKYSWTSPTIPGYVLVNASDSVVPYEKLDLSYPPSQYDRNGTGTYTVTYTDKGTMNVYYFIYAKQSYAASPKSVVGKIGSTYRIESPTIEGYTPNSSVISGSYSKKTDSRNVFYSENVYTVSYNANGGTGAPAFQYKKHFSSLTLSTETPSRSGYSFVGWSTNSMATSATYSAGSIFNTNKDTTLYAVWKQNAVTPPPPTQSESYTISYSANGGSGAPSPQTKQKDRTLTLSSTMPTRSGYSFLGWAESSTATTATYYPSGSYTANKSTTLYAVWTKVQSAERYTITYDANGGSGAPAPQTKAKNERIYLSTQEPYREGYIFEGWNESRYAISPSYDAGDAFNQNASVTLYAVWSEDEWNWEPYIPQYYSIQYNANGGVGEPYPQLKNPGQSVKLSTVKPTREGHTFLGWAAGYASYFVDYQPGDEYGIDADLVLYAVWRDDTPKPPKYYVYYDALGGFPEPEPQEKAEGVVIYLSTEVPKLAGYHFDGWSTDDDVGIPEYYPGEAYAADFDLFLYAVWREGHTHSYGPWTNHNGTSHKRVCPCGEIQYADHQWDDGKVTKKPTHYAEGRTTFTCSECEATKTEKIAKKTDHEFGAWIWIDSEWHRRECPCGEYQIEYHTWDEGMVVIFPMYGIPGDRVYTCTKCGAERGEPIDSLPYCDFTVKNLSVEETAIYRGQTITVTMTLGNKDTHNKYAAVPLTLLFDGDEIDTTYYEINAGASIVIQYHINVGDGIGEHEITARVNWEYRSIEVNSSDNEASVSFTVIGNDCDLSADAVENSQDYVEGMTVITSYYVGNDGASDITPSDHCSASFRAYHMVNGDVKVIATDTWQDVVIPKGETNLVYFKWTVSDGMAGKAVFTECTVNTSMADVLPTNNTAATTKIVKARENSQTPNTRYEDKAPRGYREADAPEHGTDVAKWTQWEYENGAFVKKNYGVNISPVSPSVKPSEQCSTAKQIGNEWIMGSGYGVEISYTPSIITANGCNAPSVEAFTDIQDAKVFFPEYAYSGSNGMYSVLEKADGKYQFISNSNADGNARVHFIPVYVNDGEYIASVTASQVWTPAGMIAAVRNANAITINGTMYSDWYQS